MNPEKILSQDELNILFGPNTKIIDEDAIVEKAMQYREQQYADKGVVDVLSQEETERLLSIMSGANPAPAETKDEPRTYPYDIRKLCGADVVEENVMDKLNKLEMRQWQLIHTNLAKQFAVKLISKLSVIVDVQVTTVDSIYHSECVFGLDNPTSYNIVKLNTRYNSGCFVIDINPSVAYAIIDLLLGGGQEPYIHARRPLTAIEEALIQVVLDDFLELLKAAWEKHFRAEIELDSRMESNPVSVTEFDAKDAVTVVCFEVMLPERHGSITLSVPTLLLQRLKDEIR